MEEYAQAAVEAALAAGARYADARAMISKTESMSAQNAVVERLQQDETAGLGVRALVGSSWGFFATPSLTRTAVEDAGRRSVDIARASGQVAGPALSLAEAGGAGPKVASWSSGCEEDPLSVPLSEKGDLMVAVTKAMHDAGVQIAQASYSVWDTRKWFVSSEGHRIDQHIRECGAWSSATAVGDNETQRRSFPGVRGQYGTRGWEVVRELDLVGTALRLADEAQALLRAPVCPSGETTLILGANQMALQLHESVGHATELDRILGWEAAFAGTSWLDLSQMGSLTFGSPLMNVIADASLPGALGSFGYDDEGTPAHRVDIIKDGVWVGVLSGRASAALAGIPSGGCVRADGFNRLPMVRMTNIGLLPGESSTEEMIADTDDGIYMDTNRSWSIDDRRLNFQFGCEIAYEIKNGKKGRMLRNPTYTGISPRFWGAMDRVGGEDEWFVMGTPNCGKGQPMQVGHTGHPTVPARFQNVRVGGDGVMDQELELADRVVALCDGAAEVTVRTGQHALTRFANSFIHQNVAESVASISLRLSYDGRTANASMTFDPSGSGLEESLRTLVARTAGAARLRPVDPEWPGLAQPAPTAFTGSYDAKTADASPGDRAALVRDFVDAAGDLETAGFCETVGNVVAFANSAGQRVAGQTSMATLDGVARTSGADASARRTSSSLADLDGVMLGRRAGTRVSSAVGAGDVEPGHYEVVLESSCVSDMMFFVAWQGFNARAVHEGRSFVTLGEQQFDRSLQIWDDAADPRTVALPFDDEGTPKQRLDLVRDGTAVGLTEDLRTAKASGTVSTGHGIEGGESEGSLACNLLLGTGSHDTDELVSQVARGLLVTDFWYTRILDPRTLVVTGLTRNGVFLIEDGKIVRPVANLRFTQSYVDAIGPDRVLGIGSVADMHKQYAAVYSVPALRLASWNFTGGAKG